MSVVHPVCDGLPTAPRPVAYRWFPSWRLLTASLLCLCFASVHMMNSNMGMAIVCMVNSSEYVDNDTVNENAAERLDWSPDHQVLSLLSPPLEPFARKQFSSVDGLLYSTYLQLLELFSLLYTLSLVPWTRILCSAPVWAAVLAVVSHEFPLMTMIMFLPSYLHDVHHYTSTKNGILSALPTASLWLSKLASSYANTWLQRHTKWRRSTICKVLNSLASLGLGVFLFASTLLDSTRAPLAVLFLCLSMASAGLHTPGCQTALVSVAPAYSGAVTGFAFFFVACSGIINPLITKWIVQNGTAAEWNSVFYISTVIALLPLFVFNLWGSAEVQWIREDHVLSGYFFNIIPLTFDYFYTPQPKHRQKKEDENSIKMLETSSLKDCTDRLSCEQADCQYAETVVEMNPKQSISMQFLPDHKMKGSTNNLSQGSKQYWNLARMQKAFLLNEIIT
uniref:Mannosyltransferase n=1 Tax=Heterorhabditis bacteriophora TaxID=37862 RepID=A0A1I7XKV7_HETBA